MKVVIPAKAGIQVRGATGWRVVREASHLDSRFRGNDGALRA